MYTQNRIQDMIAKCNNGVNVLKNRAMSDVIFKCQIVLKEVFTGSIYRIATNFISNEWINFKMSQRSKLFLFL